MAVKPTTLAWNKPAGPNRITTTASGACNPGGRAAGHRVLANHAADSDHPAARTGDAHRAKPGVFVFDFGQNLAGRAELAVKGPAGTRVVMRYGERLDKDGLLDTQDIAQHVVKKWPEQQFQTDTYVLKGKGRERWHSRFTYHGFQYVQVTGWPGTPC